MSERSFMDAYAVCQKNGYAAAIATKPQPALMQIIAIRESRCRPTAVNEKSNATGVFQMMPKYFPKLASWYTGSNTTEFIRRIKSEIPADVTFTVDVAWKDFLGLHLKKGAVQGQCTFAGQLTQLAETGSCYAYQENQVYMKWMNGEHTTSETVTDIDRPDYSNVVYKDSGGKVLATTLNCQDGSKKLAQALAKAARAYRVSSGTTTQESFYGGLEDDKESMRQARVMGQPLHPRGELKKDPAYCLSNVMLYFDGIRALMNGISWIETVISTLIKTVLDVACNYVIAAIKTTINNLLASICIPIPNISLDLGLSGLGSGAKACNGLSLASFIAIGAGAATPASAMAGTSPLTKLGVVPAINSIPSARMTTPSIAEPLRRVFGTTNSGDKDVR